MKEVPDTHVGVSATSLMFLSSLIFLIAMRYELDRGCHSVHTLTYQYVCCVKYRREIFDSEDIITRLKEFNIMIVFLLEAENGDHDFLLPNSSVNGESFLNRSRKRPNDLPRYTGSLVVEAAMHSR